MNNEQNLSGLLRVERTIFLGKILQPHVAVLPRQPGERNIHLPLSPLGLWMRTLTSSLLPPLKICYPLGPTPFETAYTDLAILTQCLIHLY